MKSQEEIWNELAGQKTFTTPLDIELFEKYLRKEARILDFGCGYGRICSELFLQGYKNLIGVDVAENLLVLGREKLPNIEFINLDDFDYEAHNNSFDAVFLIAVLTTIAENDKQNVIINNIYKLLKPNGILYIADYLLNTDDRNILRYDKYSKESSYEYGSFVLEEGLILRHHKIDYIKQLLHNFHIEEYYETKYTTMNGNESNGFQMIAKK